jgi:hypothetical protein
MRRLAGTILPVFLFALPFAGLAQTGASTGVGAASGLRRLESARAVKGPPYGLQKSAEAALVAAPAASTHGGARVETWRGRIRGGLMGLFGDVSLGASVEEEWVAYDRGADALPGWPENVRIDRLSLNAGWRPAGDWSYFGSGILSVGVGAGDGGWNQGIAVGGMAFGRRQVTPDFAWLIGIIAYDRLGESPLVMPVPGMDWRITPRVTLVTAQGLMVNYRADDEGEWRLSGSVLFDSTVCAIRDSGGKAIVRDESVPVVPGIEHRSRGGVRLRAFGGVSAWRRWQMDRADGKESTWRGGPAAIFGIECGRTF